MENVVHTSADYLQHLKRLQDVIIYQEFLKSLRFGVKYV